MSDKFGIKNEIHDADVCVVGGGMAGICSAISSARHGARVVLIHDRPVLGGNASSEVRVHICGANQGKINPNMRETGILEEIQLENLRRNPEGNYSVWDLILYEKVFFQKCLTLLLNCSCQNVEIDGNSIKSVTGWQLTTETYHTVEAKVFIDCSGDGILAPLAGAEFRMGREANHEYNESIAPEVADDKTMGMTCLIQTRRYDNPKKYEPPSWIYSFKSDDEIPYGARGHKWWEMGYWWVELGGEKNSIHDTERLRDELLKIALGVWDHIKNQGEHGAENWDIEWIEFLPGKRESRRYVGGHVLTQNDIESEGRFEDIVAYGGWTMDDHDPAGFWSVKIGHPSTIHHKSPSPYGISYRCLYSRNIINLMSAGRCASCTHSAMSSTRVMGTGCSMGQAVGTASALAVKYGILPRQIGEKYVEELQQALIRDDCYIPWKKQQLSETTLNAKVISSKGNAEPLRDGINRPVKENTHCWTAELGDWAGYIFEKETFVNEATLILDSALDELIFMSKHGSYDALTSIPDCMPEEFRVEELISNEWKTVKEIEGNYQRLVRIPVSQRVNGIRFVLEKLWGNSKTRVFAFYVD